MQQLQIEPVVDDADAERQKAIDRFMHANRVQYLGFARAIAPDLRDWTAVWDRLAFAILTANAEVESAHRAFRLARDNGRIAPSVWGVPGMTPEKSWYVNALPRRDDIFVLLRQPRESWDHHRLRLARVVRGLALTKASYATCLLYPLSAQVACLDTWMLRLLIGTSHFVSLPYQTYVALERVVATYARRHRVPTNIAQWMMWDWARRTTTPQRFFD